ncbi:polysaccharide deacetylase family protein [Sporosarcina sp. JAI121]|uniref:polysaccharide deacetylase family protein n=1 Tax=Sporosarcina sp. JAI121 TaxID=2723064 RepID=UPI0015CED2C0|nr:polysaccharide deacetylase family protein [Sporosarcina sp. JAI121]NYF23775.1 peptidoglycan/xylan/chitin deacetylase (PgdA/CDA1 family) [Sporosarcina sp. JAI121]
MKKITLFLLLFFVAFPAFTDASTVKSIKITETTPVFDEYKKVAVFMKGTSHTIFNESDRFYHTVIGNDEVKFSKKKAVVIKAIPTNWKGSHPVRATTTTSKPVQILERPAVKAKSIGQIQPNMTINVQRIKGNYYPVLIGGKTGYIHKNELAIGPGIPVLMYHDIVSSKTDQNPSTLEVEKFKEQMDYLKKNGWTTITTQQLESWITKKGTLPKKSILITFDDGYKSTIDLAYPILKTNGFKATSFLITSRIDRPSTVSEQDIIRSQDVYSYQNHTHLFHMFNSFTNLSLLQYESELAIFKDFQEANDSIKQILGDDYRVTAHAYPYGKRSLAAIRALKSAGITSAYTIDEGNVFQGDSLFELKRQRIHSTMTIKDFAQKLQGR